VLSSKLLILLVFDHGVTLGGHFLAKTKKCDIFGTKSRIDLKLGSLEPPNYSAQDRKKKFPKISLGAILSAILGFFAFCLFQSHLSASGYTKKRFYFAQSERVYGKPPRSVEWR